MKCDKAEKLNATPVLYLNIYFSLKIKIPNKCNQLVALCCGKIYCVLFFLKTQMWMRNIVTTVPIICVGYIPRPLVGIRSPVLNSLLGFPVCIYTCAEAYKLPKVYQQLFFFFSGQDFSKFYQSGSSRWTETTQQHSIMAPKPKSENAEVKL